MLQEIFSFVLYQLFFETEVSLKNRISRKMIHNNI